VLSADLLICQLLSYQRLSAFISGKRYFPISAMSHDDGDLGDRF